MSARRVCETALEELLGGNGALDNLIAYGVKGARYDSTGCVIVGWLAARGVIDPQVDPASGTVRFAGGCVRLPESLRELAIGFDRGLYPMLERRP